MKLFITVSLVSLCSFSSAAEPIVPYSDPANTGGWSLNESVSDEFEGDSLDLTKWNNLGLNGDYYGEWKGRAPSQYDAANVKVSDGQLTISSRWDPNFKFAKEEGNNGLTYGTPAPVTTACIISKSKFHYGYMEMRCRAAEGPVSSSFWTTGVGGEIDVFEHYGENQFNKYSASRYHTSFHDWRKGSAFFGKRIWTNDHQLGFRVADDFHVYGLEWSENFLKIYVDGMLIRCTTKTEMGDKWVATGEQKVWIDSEAFDWEVKPTDLKASHFGEGSDFIVDYCRIWQRKGPSSGCEPGFNLLTNAGFETGEKVWKGSAKLSDDARSGKRAAAMIDGGVDKGSVFEQTVDVKPNTTYVLAAWAKSPGTNKADLWFNASLGARDFGGPEVTTRFFMPDFERKSVQFTTGPNAKSVVIFFTNNPHGRDAIIDDIELIETQSAR